MTTTNESAWAARPTSLDGCRLGLLALDEASRPVLSVIEKVLRRRHFLAGSLWLGDRLPPDLAQRCEVLVIGVGDAGALAEAAEQTGVPWVALHTVDPAELDRLAQVGSSTLLAGIENALIARTEAAAPAGSGDREQPECTC
jgi:hypothetical protein